MRNVLTLKMRTCFLCLCREENDHRDAHRKLDDLSRSIVRISRFNPFPITETENG
uniref:Uncharacterized protein n=1 Tax=Utricularia reniformis TaxID=192314 RepID=A0A1Y0B0B7_9LAMI|nr:hypothetical protein AEK19_MT0584 [Utricularia reniformis]ART30840.1 hypothetical protein AEK19_MT0584 [Utricularia reniformis]